MSSPTAEEPKEATSDKPKSVWLNAWHDPLAGLKAYSSCIALADMYGDGDSKLFIADLEKKLKVYKGCGMVNESALLDQPVAMVSYYMDYTLPRKPVIAVASGPHIFIYKNMRPYFKFTLPAIEINAREQEIWAALRDNKIPVGKALEQLDILKEEGVRLTSRSSDLLCLEDPAEQEKLVNETKGTPLQQQTVITSLAVLRKDRDEEDGIGSLLVGTENNFVIILHPSEFTPIKTVEIPSTPVFLQPSGLFDVDYRISISCRNGNIYAIKNGELVSTMIELESQPCGIAWIDKSILVGTMNNALHSFHFKGKKQYSIYLPAPITNMEVLCMKSMRHSRALLVALANGEVRIYNGKTLISVLETNDVVTGMKFGQYGREENTLVMVFKSGALSIKMLPRTTSLEVPAGVTSGPPAEQDVPLRVPKKTKLYVELAAREREFGVDMHRTFQRDLCKLRLATARAYVKIITDGQGPLSYTAGSSIRLTAQVQGLGPVFKIKLSIQNTGSKALTAVPIIFSFNQQIYRVKQPLITVPCLVPSLLYKYEEAVECIDPDAGADVVKIYVCNPGSCVPIITAIVNMPLSEFLIAE